MYETRQRSCSRKSKLIPLFSPAEILCSLIVDMTYVAWRKAAAASGSGGRGRGGSGSRDADYQGQQIACSCLRSTRSLWLFAATLWMQLFLSKGGG